MHPILARFGPFLVYSYEVVLGVGIIVCIALSAWLLKENQSRREQWYDTALIGAFLAILSGRAVYVLAHWDYFSEAPQEIWLVWRGGLSYHGALVAFLVGIWLWTKLRHRQFSDYAEVIALDLPLLSAFGWLACLLDGCAFGRTAEAGILVADLPDSLGVYELRYETQLMGLILSALIFGALFYFRRRMEEVPLFWLSLLLVSASHFNLGLYRGDEMVMIGTVRLDVLVDGLLAVLALTSLVIETRRLAGTKRGADLQNKNSVSSN